MRLEHVVHVIVDSGTLLEQQQRAFRTSSVPTDSTDDLFVAAQAIAPVSMECDSLGSMNVQRCPTEEGT